VSFCGRIIISRSLIFHWNLNLILPSFQQKGCGLFALLPEPKNDALFRLGSGAKPIQNNPEKPTTSDSKHQHQVVLKPATSTQLIPHAVRQGLAGKRPASEHQRLVAKYMKQESNFRIVSKPSSTAEAESKGRGDDSDEDQETSGGDFFSLEAGAGDDETFEASNPELPSAQSSIQVNIHPEVEDYLHPNSVETEPLPTPFEHQVQTVAPDLVS